MNERGLFLDLDRIALGRPAIDRWWEAHVYITPKDHRMHTVCGTLESLGYLERAPLRAPGPQYSAWRFTPQGAELYLDLMWEWATA